MLFMTPPPHPRVDRAKDIASLHALLQLALGIPRPAQGLDWRALLAGAETERLLPLIWLRSADFVRRNAPAAISATWQKRAIVSGLVAKEQLDALAEASVALGRRGVSAVVLKGFPLAQRLYGDYTVRAVLDSDLYVRADERAAASSVLISLGWRCTSGCAPEEERFERHVGSHTCVLEVHSTALDDRLLDHVQLPVEQQLVRVDGHELPAHSGRFVPAYLATHLAKHDQKPLLWAVDFSVLWEALSASDRRDAIAASREAGLGRHLDWAVRIRDRVAAACGQHLGSADSAMRGLERSLEASGDSRRLVRLVSLSASPTAAARVLAGRVWPLAWRDGWRHAPQYFLRRGVAWLYRHLVFEKPSAIPAESDDATISLMGDDCEQRLVAMLDRDSAAWISPADGSMEPAIPRFARARVVSLNGRGVKHGDVVLMRDAGGRCSLQRVTSLGPDSVRLRPDSRQRAEESAAYEALLGVCDLVDVSDTPTPTGQRPHGAITMFRAILRRQRLARRTADRLMYVCDFESMSTSVARTTVQFEELTAQEIRERAANLKSGGEAIPPNGNDMGCVVGTLSGRQVYHVWYVRGDGSRLRGLPAGWRPRGNVLFLHGGYTEPEFRARGIHTAALRWLLARERDCGTAHAIGVVNRDNVPALRAVESVGFRAVGRVT